MKENKIKVLKIEPGEPPAVKEIGNDLHSLQAEVGGLIECISFPNGCVVVCNEEGKLNGMRKSFARKSQRYLLYCPKKI